MSTLLAPAYRWVWRAWAIETVAPVALLAAALTFFLTTLLMLGSLPTAFYSSFQATPFHAHGVWFYLAAFLTSSRTLPHLEIPA